MQQPDIASHQSPGKSIEVSNSADDDNRIQNFEADGFQIGKDPAANKSTVVYQYVAFAEESGAIRSGSYTGDGQDNRDLNTPGLEPAYVIIKQDEGESAVQRFTALTGISRPISIRRCRSSKLTKIGYRSLS